MQDFAGALEIGSRTFEIADLLLEVAEISKDDGLARVIARLSREIERLFVRPARALGLIAKVLQRSDDGEHAGRRSNVAVRRVEGQRFLGEIERFRNVPSQSFGERPVSERV